MQRLQLFGKFVLGAAGLVLLFWQMSSGCAGVGVACDDKVCLVTAFKRCSAAKDCCCSQVCALGCCLPRGQQSTASCLGSGTPDSGPLPENIVVGNCTNGQTRECFPASPASIGVGECKAGQQRCEGGQWGACTGYVLPVIEACDGQDNDCDGSIDEGLACSCKPAERRACGSGDCAGFQTCNGQGEWSVCVPSSPAQEVCDGQDNDCDGLVDDGAGCEEIAAGMERRSNVVVQLWNRTTGRTLRLLADAPRQRDTIHAIAYRPDGKELATASKDQSVRLWDPDDGSSIRTMGPNSSGHGDEVLALAYTPDGKTLASGDASGDIILWETATGRSLRTLSGGHTQAVHSLAFTADGAQLLSAGNDGKLILWNPSNGRSQATIDASGAIRQMSLNSSGELAATIAGRNLQIWDLQTRKLLREYTHSDPLFGVAFSPTVPKVVVTTAQREIQRWDINLPQDTPWNQWAVTWANLNNPRGIAFHPLGDMLALVGTATAGERVASVFLFDLRRALELRLGDAYGAATAVAFRP